METPAWRAYVPTAVLLPGLVIAVIVVLSAGVTGTGQEAPELVSVELVTAYPGIKIW